LASDFNGNLTDDGSTLYSYDEENRLIKAVDKVSGHVLGQYQYDVVGRRVSVIDTFGVQTYYYYDGVRTIEEQSPAGTTLATYVFGNYLDEVLSMDRILLGGNQTFYYHQNALHSVFALTDSTGTVVEAYDYDAYGAPTVILPGRDGVIHYDEHDSRLPGARSFYGNPFFFTGQRYDSDTELMYYKQRYYSPALGRFMTRDPIGIWADLNNLGNGYAYVGDNPVTWDDPYGTKGWGWLKKIGQAISNTAHDVAKAIVKIAKAIVSPVVQKVAGLISDIKNVVLHNNLTDPAYSLGFLQ
jgi:RHS repeat-associated protein